MTDSNLARQFAKQVIRKAQKIPAAKKAPSETAKKLSELKRLESRDETHIIILQNRIKELEGELNRKNRARKHEDEINEQRIESLTSELNNLKTVLREKGIQIRTPTEKRVEAIEKISKAKSKYVEVLELEEKLSKMEDRYERLLGQRKFSSESLEVIKLAIEKLREMLKVKKFELEKEKELKPRHVVRHTMKFEMPAPKKSIPAEEGKIELPPLPGGPDLTIPKPPKKSIFKRLLFGK